MRLKPQTDESLTGGVEEPWIVKDAIAFLDERIHPSWNALEWGAGSSTPWLLARCNRLTTIEHDPEWAIKVIESMQEHHAERLHKWEFRLIPPNDVLVYGEYAGADGRDYIEYVNGGHSVMPQIVFIDGRARTACLWMVNNHIQPDLIVLDNSEREAYQGEIERIPWPWKRHDFHNGQWQTTVWER